jgi:DNA-binding GntR family transcriptional regulator
MKLVSRPTLRDQIKDALLQRILQGTYAPGERIVEIRVAREFGVSQAPVREALRELEILRLIESEPFRGARVRGVRPEEIAETYPVRAALEAGNGMLAGRLVREHIEGFGRSVAEGLARCSSGDGS